MKHKILLVLFLSFMACFTASAQKVTLQFRQVKLAKVFDAITQQTGLTVAYSRPTVDPDRVVSIEADKEELSDVLTQLLKDTNVTFEIGETKIYLKEEPVSGTLQKSGRLITISGTIVDEKGETIIGASVAVQGTTLGTITNADGEYSLANVPENSQITISFIGYQSISLPANAKALGKIVMKEDNELLDEVVVIGYGTTTVKSATGSISSVKANELQSYPSTNFASALSGKMAGVQVSLPSGAPGGSPVINVRGIGTLTAGSKPLIVVDGFPLTEGSDINSINMSAIQSIEVLKDAASTAIYGSRGANGIIMITTKSGKTSKPNVSLSATFSLQQRYDKLELVDAYDMAQYMLEARNTGYVNKNPSVRKESDDTATRKANGASKRELIPDYLYPYLNGEKGLTNTNWLDEIFQLAPMQDYNISVSGGSEKAFYSLSAGYMKQEGIVIGTDFDKFSANVNLKLMPSNTITLGFSFSPSYSKKNTFDEDAMSSNFLNIATGIYPFFAPYNEDGTLTISEQIKANADTDGALYENPVAIAKKVKRKNDRLRLFGNMYAEVKLFKDFRFKTYIGADYDAQIYKFYTPSDIGKYRAAAPQPISASQSNTNRKNYLIENTLTYNKLIKEHSIQILLGQSYQREDQEVLKVTAADFGDSSIQNIAGGSSFKVEPSQYSWAMISYFARLNYNWQDKYIFSASMRRDGSSRFGNNTKWGMFPALSAAWLISNEKFMSNCSAIDYAKLRVSWGKSGNNQIANYGAQALMSNNDYLFGGTLAPGTVINASPNPDLSWEMTSTWNIGLDVTLFKYLGISADFYLANTNDLLLSVPVPQQSGYTTSLQNIGKVRNTGFEIRFSTAKDIEMGPVSWNSSLNLSTNKNKVLALAPGQTQIIGSKGFSITEVGKSISELYGYEIIGIYKSDEDFKKYPAMPGTQIGDYIIKNQNDDNVINTKDKKSFGSPLPKVVLGWNNTFRYKSFELTLDLYSELGKKLYSTALATYMDTGEGFAVTTKEYFNNRYHPVNNPNGTYATPNMGNFSSARKEARISNKFFYNASNFNIRSLKFSYELPSSFINRLGLQRTQVYFLANNLLLLTPYKGMSLNGNAADALNQGLESYNYPLPRTFSLGLNINF